MDEPRTPTLAEPFASAFWLRVIAAEQEAKQTRTRHLEDLKALEDKIAKLRADLERGHE